MDYLPVVVKKGRNLLEQLTGGDLEQRCLCPRGRFLACIDGECKIRVHDVGSPGIGCTIAAHRFTRYVDNGCIRGSEAA